MKLTCPSCGAIASADAWDNDAMWRELLGVVSQLPSAVSKTLLGYLTLFRPGKSALSIKKALRLAREISVLVGSGNIEINTKVARPCPARIWAQAMEQMIERRHALSLPLKNHNYLRQIVYTLADQEDAQREQINRQNEASGNHRDQGARTRFVSTEHDDGMLPIERILKERERRNTKDADKR